MWILLIIIAYFIGSISSGYLIGKFSRGIDIRNHGSKNAGATNAFRVLGKTAGVLTLFFDGLKGFVVITAAQLMGFSPTIVIFAGIAVIAGHNWPVFLGFRGGRGVATSIGIIFGISWQVFITVLIIGLIPLIITRYVSVGSLTGAVVFPWIMILFGEPLPYLIFAFIMSILAIVRHISNIKRLIAGTERKLGQ